MRNRHISMARRRSLERRVLEREGAHALTEWSVGGMGRRTMESGGGVDGDLSFSDPVALAMDELRPEFKDAVWLCDVEDLTYAEAAQRLACPVGTIMSRLHRGRRALRRRLGSRRQLEAA
jgi:RNA polymerase sigma-70 factor (ECF subfamily)